MRPFRVPRLVADDLGAVAGGELLAPSDFGEGSRIGRDGFGHGLAIDELPFTAAGNEPSFAEYFEMVRDGCGGHAAHGDNLATSHLLGCRDGLKDPEAGLVG
jgi:hypothetical protein